MSMPLNPGSVIITLEADYYLTADECWPDGEPESWSADDIAEVIRDYRSLSSFLSEWCLGGATLAITDSCGKTSRVALR